MNRTLSRCRQRGFSLVEIVVASLVGLAALSGALYLYRNQHRSMMVQSEISTMRMNGQFTLNETKYSLARAGLGLPPDTRFIAVNKGDLVIKSNPSKKSSPGQMSQESNSSRTAFRIPEGDIPLFEDKGYAVALAEAGVVETEILSVIRVSGSAGLITLATGKDAFTSSTKIYPMERLRLHRCQGDAGDGPEGDFRMVLEKPGVPSIPVSSLTLAEGIESIDFRYHMLNKTETAVLPDNLDALEQIEIIVKVRGARAESDGAAEKIPRQTLRAKVNYRRAL
ncbi:MAG TPA: prepilin-type N-terminal cleavage/methylation domain-containing protein [Fibrobacteria bacterium]|nr:prepilin-type N-terminal cleavage/methylation domain-containing protein [Fibrobacteria bacterium]